MSYLVITIMAQVPDDTTAEQAADIAVAAFVQVEDAEEVPTRNAGYCHNLIRPGEPVDLDLVALARRTAKP